jgi:hypothetical protein
VEGTTGCNLSCTQAFLTPDGALWPFLHVVAISCIRKTKIWKMRQVTIFVPRACRTFRVTNCQEPKLSNEEKCDFLWFHNHFSEQHKLCWTIVHLSYYLTNYMFVDRPTSSDKELEIDISLVKIFLSMNMNWGLKNNNKKIMMQRRLAPSPIVCLWLSTYLYLHHMCFILSDLKCYESTTSSFRNHLWSAKEKKYWKKKKKAFQLIKWFLFIYLFFWDPFYF